MLLGKYKKMQKKEDKEKKILTYTSRQVQPQKEHK
jgi:hypothetical protein